MMARVVTHSALATALMALAFQPAPASAQTPVPRPSVFQTTLEEPNQLTPEITTQELQAILAAGIVPVFDVRTAEEYAIAHIPGTINIYEKEIENIRALYPLADPTNPPPMILYCNGPSCGKSKRTSEELFKLGYTNVKRYQLGIPVWRALSLTVQTDMPGLLYIFTRDHTSVFVDARTPAEFAFGTIPGAVNVQAGEAVAANDDGRLPFRDKSTRVVVFGNTSQQAKVVAAEIAKRAYWGSSYFGGTLDDLLAAGLINHPPVVRAKDAIVAAGAACTAVVTAADVDNGSFDPNGESLGLTVTPAGPLGLGQQAIILTGTDARGASSSAPATATVTDWSAPTIGTVSVDSDRPRPRPQQGWVAVTLTYAVSDNCGTVTTGSRSGAPAGMPMTPRSLMLTTCSCAQGCPTG
jgi:rhodanese-related sulfurtransferase